MVSGYDIRKLLAERPRSVDPYYLLGFFFSTVLLLLTTITVESPWSYAASVISGIELVTAAFFLFIFPRPRVRAEIYRSGPWLIMGLAAVIAVVKTNYSPLLVPALWVSLWAIMQFIWKTPYHWFSYLEKENYMKVLASWWERLTVDILPWLIGAAAGSLWACLFYINARYLEVSSNLPANHFAKSAEVLRNGFAIWWDISWYVSAPIILMLAALAFRYILILGSEYVLVESMQRSLQVGAVCTTVIGMLAVSLDEDFISPLIGAFGISFLALLFLYDRDTRRGESFKVARFSAWLSISIALGCAVYGQVLYPLLIPAVWLAVLLVFVIGEIRYVPEHLRFQLTEKVFLDTVKMPAWLMTITVSFTSMLLGLGLSTVLYNAIGDGGFLVSMLLGYLVSALATLVLAVKTLRRQAFVRLAPHIITAVVWAAMTQTISAQGG